MNPKRFFFFITSMNIDTFHLDDACKSVLWESAAWTKTWKVELWNRTVISVDLPGQMIIPHSSSPQLTSLTLYMIIRLILNIIIYYICFKIFKAACRYQEWNSSGLRDRLYYLHELLAACWWNVLKNRENVAEVQQLQLLFLNMWLNMQLLMITFRINWDLEVIKTS